MEPIALARGALCYRAVLPLGWLALDALPGEAAIARLEESNLRILSAVLILEEHSKLSDEPTAQELELVRIHNKLDLLLELVGGLLHRDAARPPATALRLSWQGVTWQPPRPPLVGTAGLVELYLHPVMSQPLTFPSRIVPAGPEECCAEFAGVSEAMQAALERHVFLHHRREVAETRQPARGTAKGHAGP